MSYFSYKNQTLHAENINLNDIAKKFSTPCYVYSKASILDAFSQYSEALGNHPGTICYAVKANSNLAVLQILAQAGAGFDIVSQGELERVLKAGGDPQKTIFSGVGKKSSELAFALDNNIACFNVESAMELERLNDVAHQLNKVANISLRVNPDVDAKTHPYISTGLKENKFGIDINAAKDVYLRAKALSNINIVGVDCHIGSQLTDLAPFIDALDRLLILIDDLATEDIIITHLDLGGGIGVTYQNESPPDIKTYLDKVKTKIQGRNLSLSLEPGRSIVANAGVLLTEVEYLKPNPYKNFAIVDAAMNDNIRPALYQAWQAVKPVNELPKEANTRAWDIVGPVCETGDFLAKDRQLNLAQGDILALMSSGAYGFVMSSNYNTRGRAAEVLVDNSTVTLIRKRETFDEIVQNEILLEL